MAEGVDLVLGAMLFYGLGDRVYKRAAACVLVPVAQLGFVVTAGLGFVFLRETLTLRRGFGPAFAIAALLCLTRS